MKFQLPGNPNIDYLKLRAKILLQKFKQGEKEAIARVKTNHPRLDKQSGESFELVLREAQLVIAREYGFSTWAQLKEHVDGVRQQKAKLAKKSATSNSIMKAAKSGNADKVFEMLEKEPDLINASTYHNDTPLMMALYRKHVKLACELVRRGADPFSVTMEPDWPVALAVRKGMTEFLETVNETQKNVPNLFKAVFCGSASKVTKELKKDSSALEVFLPDTYCGMTPLFYAVIRGEIEIVKTLIDAGANVDAGNSDNNLYNPLLSSLDQDIKITELLIESGADTTGIIMPFRRVSPKVIRLFSRLGKCGSPLIAALYERSKPKVRKILKSNPQLARDSCPNGFPTLVLAVELEDVDLIKDMIDAGADLEAKIDNPVLDGLKGTALEYAADKGAADIVKLLADSGARTDTNNHSAMRSAIWQYGYGYKYVRRPDYKAIIKLLKKNGSPVDGLSHAVEAGALEKVEFLISEGACVNELDEKGFTPLDYCTAVTSNWGRDPQFHKDVAELLIANGAKHSSELKERITART